MSLSALKARGLSFIGHKKVNIDSDSQTVTVTEKDSQLLAHDHSQGRERS